MNLRYSCVNGELHPFDPDHEIDAMEALALTDQRKAGLPVEDTTRRIATYTENGITARGPGS